MAQNLRAATKSPGRRAASDYAVDLIVGAAVLVLLYLIVRVGRGATVSSSQRRVSTIDTASRNLPYNAARSLLRMLIALGISTVFTLVYAYAAARSKRAEKVLIPLLDILQSVPVLGFLSITITGFVALFPGSYVGREVSFVEQQVHACGSLGRIVAVILEGSIVPDRTPGRFAGWTSSPHPVSAGY
jgi:NitT/TauT family transport system permease protein